LFADNYIKTIIIKLIIRNLDIVVRFFQFKRPLEDRRMLSISLLFIFLTFPFSKGYDNGSNSSLPILGWNSWCTDDYCGLLDLCFEEEIHEIADAMVESGMVSAGYRLIELVSTLFLSFYINNNDDFDSE